ncbi:uncharacterized protein LOC107045938 isoform X1 [Diachasma alloeum]|uniref:uncharacterized protein LOC107045938 isoform X1 n=1 Tax=Diachasma alloeum TaxID=454923 RepID=UPI0007381841|nr:uncharacterized protein LOC107045938 isoform X1 [Diachasma alloeum]
MTRDMDPDLIHQNFLSRQSRFSELKEHFIDISGPHVTGEVLESLKEYYSGIIQSKRDKDRVKNIAGLLRILERRDVLRYDSIEPLKEIAKECIRDRILIETLTCYDAEIKTELPLPAINHYKYSGEYFESTSVTEYLLNKRDNGDGLVDHDITDPRVEETQAYETTEEQLLSAQTSVNKNRLSGSKCFRHPHHTHHFLCIKSSRWREKFSLIVIFSVLVVFLTIIATIYMHFINCRSSAVEGSSQSSSRSQTHAVNFYPNQTSLPVVPYATPSAPTSSGPVSDVQERVFQRLSENLGKYWRDLARFLNVKECEIDAINEKTYLGTKEKAYEALLIFKSRCDSCNWKIKMQQALEKARRKDLAEMINEIMLSDNLF